MREKVYLFETGKYINPWKKERIVFHCKKDGIAYGNKLLKDTMKKLTLDGVKFKVNKPCSILKLLNDLSWKITTEDGSKVYLYTLEEVEIR